MNFALKTLLAAAGLVGALGAMAQQLPAGAPAGTTVQCKDGSFASPDKKSGACRGHKGIDTWYGPAGAARRQRQQPSGCRRGGSTRGTAPAPMAAAPAAKAGKPDLSTMAAAPGGGAGKVWVNDSTKVYHCSTDPYYGKTKKGEYMSEADAKAKGAHASHGKACS